MERYDDDGENYKSIMCRKNEDKRKKKNIVGSLDLYNVTMLILYKNLYEIECGLKYYYLAKALSLIIVFYILLEELNILLKNIQTNKY